MSNKRKSVRIVMMSGDKELSSFEGSDFKNVDDMTKTLNKLVQLVSAVVLSVSVHTLAKVSKSGSTKEVMDFTNHLFDSVVESTRDKIKTSINDFSTNFDTESMKGGDA